MGSSRQVWLGRLAIIGWWFVFVLVVASVTSFPRVFTGRPPNFWGNMGWHSGWLIWCVLTFLAIYLARKFPLDRKRLKAHLLIQFLFGFLVVALGTLLEFSCFYLVSLITEDRMEQPLNFLASLIAYKSHLNLVIYWAIVGATNAYDYYIKFREVEMASSKLEAKLAQSELQALKSQLQPHFLFNTHHSIISLMLKDRKEEAITMLTQLSDLLRTTLEKNQQQLSSLKEELETLELYLSIQKVRFEDRLEIEKSVPAELLDAEVPYLLLQPLVENALKHGIDPKPDGGKLILEVHKEAGRLTIEISDNGLGMGIESAEAETNGIGLQTCRIRLAQLYGDEHIFSIESAPVSGTKIIISIPHSKERASG